jgi:hypothetical protein
MKYMASILISACMAGVPMHTSAADEALTLTIENDILTGSDNNYTNGFGLTWVSRDLESYDDDAFNKRWGKFWSFLPYLSDEGTKIYASWSLVQEMHTPDEIRDPNPPLDDQPYAGILYVDSVLYARKERWAHAWQLKLGVVGPSSQADTMQKEFHKMAGADEPKGWHTQLPDEPVINVGYMTAHLLAEGDVGKSASWRIIPVATAGLGNYFTGVGVGLYGEVGWNLVEALGSTALRSGFNAASTVGAGPVHGWSVSFSGGLAAYGVAHYLPLDGTVFKSSRSVDSEPFVGMATLGVSVRNRNLVLGLTATYFSDTFKTQRSRPEFGTLSLSWFY